MLLVSKQWGSGDGYDGANPSWGSGGKGTKTLPIVYTKWYIPVVAYGNNINWQPENSAVTAYKVSLSQLNIWAKEGSNFWFITVGI